MHRSTILRALHRLGLSTKKEDRARGRGFTTELRNARQAFFWNVQPTVDAKDAIFVDETGCHPGMGPRRGWAPVGARLTGAEAAYSGGRRVWMIAASLHKNPEVLRILERRPCRVVFVPPYSPDTNPIEMAFSTIKHHVRKAVALTMRAVRDALSNACATITRRDARNYIHHAGYS